jgi:hypothetical protein
VVAVAPNLDHISNTKPGTRKATMYFGCENGTPNHTSTRDPMVWPMGPGSLSEENKEGVTRGMNNNKTHCNGTSLNTNEGR